MLLLKLALNWKIPNRSEDTIKMQTKFPGNRIFPPSGMQSLRFIKTTIWNFFWETCTSCCYTAKELLSSEHHIQSCQSGRLPTENGLDVLLFREKNKESFHQKKKQCMRTTLMTGNIWPNKCQSTEMKHTFPNISRSTNLWKYFPNQL